MDQEEQQFDNLIEYVNENIAHEQHTQRIQSNNQQMVYQQENLNYKNLPKLIGSKLMKWIKRLMKEKKIQVLPQGIINLIKSKEECKQQNFTIKDLQELCNDDDSKKIFQEFILDEFFLDIVHSNKIGDPYSYIPGISNYYSAASEPHKMKSNYLTRNYFTNTQQLN